LVDFLAKDQEAPSPLKFLLAALAESDGESYLLVSLNELARRPVMGWWELAKVAFYLIGSAVFQCMEYK
jgi:hypothetical protein